MSKRVLTGLLAAVMVLSGLVALPAHGATTVPEVVQITDPVNDANFVNDQDRTEPQVAGQGGDNRALCDAGAPECDASTVSDLIKVWFTNTADTVSLHILTQRPPPAISTIYYRVASNPGEGPIGASTARGCLNWRMIFGGKQAAPGAGPVPPQTIDTSTYRGNDLASGSDHAEFEDVCNVEGLQEPLEVTRETLEDGTGITTMTVDRAASPLFAESSKITSPYALSRLVVGVKGQELPTGGSFFSAAQADNTKRGSEYALLDDGVIPPPPPPPPPPCKKKQRQTCKCPAFVPAEQGAEAELTKVTDQATAKNPVEVTVSTKAGAGVGGVPVVESGISHAYENLQVVTKKKKTPGLYVRLEMPERSDYDLTLLNPDGTRAAMSAGFNPHPDPAIGDGTGTGGHSETTAEQIDGIKTPNCGGYTADVGTATGVGGGLTMKLWLGKPTYEQLGSDEGAGRAALSSAASRSWSKASRYF